MKSFLIYAWSLWILGTTWLALPVRLPIDPKFVDYDRNTILVSHQATTGPHYRVLSGQEALRESLKTFKDLELQLSDDQKLSVAEVELIGRKPTDYIRPEYQYETDWVLYGKVEGHTDKWAETGSGIIPVFFVKRCRPTKYVPNLFNRSGFIADAVMFSVFLGLPVLVIISFSVLVRSFIKRLKRLKTGKTGELTMPYTRTANRRR